MDKDIEILNDFLGLNTWKYIDLDYWEGSEMRPEQNLKQAIKNLINYTKKYKNMYESEHRIHEVRNEQLSRKELGIQKAKQLEQDNLQLIDLYKRTAKKLKENGKDELADYFLAQIDAIPTFSVGSSYDQWININELEELYNQMKEQTTYRQAYFLFEKFMKEKTEPKYPT